MDYELTTEQQAGVYRPRRTARPAPRRSSAAAQLLSFLWPGFGQFYLSQTLRGLLFAIPPLLLVVGLLFLVAQSPQAFAVQLLVPSFALAMLALLAIHGLWRVLAIVDAWNSARTRPVTRDTAAPLMLLLALIIVVSHAFAGYLLLSLNAAGEKIFQGGQGALDDLVGGGSGSAIPESGPINVLFVGVDSAANRDHALTDTVMLASYDRSRGRVIQISIPRDTGRLPMFDGSVYPNRINSLVGYVRRNPERYPDPPIETLAREVGYLLGVDVHYYAVVNMAGFRELIDEVGGIDVQVEKAIQDSHHHIYLQPGRHHLDGEEALDFVRSRYGPGNSDYERARRQQQVIRALSQRMQDPFVLGRLPDVMAVAGELVRTNVPREQLGELMALNERAGQADTVQVVLAPRKYAERVPPELVGGRFMTQLKMDAVAELSVELFGEHSRYATSSQD